MVARGVCSGWGVTCPSKGLPITTPREGGHRAAYSWFYRRSRTLGVYAKLATNSYFLQHVELVELTCGVGLALLHRYLKRQQAELGAMAQACDPSDSGG